MSTLFDDFLPRPAVSVREGVAHLPGWLSLEQQQELVAQAREIARSVAGTPLAMTRPQLASGQMSAYILSLGQYWRTQPYGYVSQVDGVPVPPLPESFARLAVAAVAQAAEVDPAISPWTRGRFRPEIALVNYYPPGAHMGMHVDDSEESSAPVVSLSIGDEALFRMGNTEGRNKPWDDVTLMSGDLIVFGGPARWAYHGVQKVRDATLPPSCGLREGRLNITIRQVA